jgi:hypothetical protein
MELERVAAVSARREALQAASSAAAKAKQDAEERQRQHRQKQDQEWEATLRDRQERMEQWEQERKVREDADKEWTRQRNSDEEENRRRREEEWQHRQWKSERRKDPAPPPPPPPPPPSRPPQTPPPPLGSPHGWEKEALLEAAMAAALSGYVIRAPEKNTRTVATETDASTAISALVDTNVWAQRREEAAKGREHREDTVKQMQTDLHEGRRRSFSLQQELDEKNKRLENTLADLQQAHDADEAPDEEVLHVLRSKKQEHDETVRTHEEARRLYMQKAEELVADAQKNKGTQPTQEENAKQTRVEAAKSPNDSLRVSFSPKSHEQTFNKDSPAVQLAPVVPPADKPTRTLGAGAVTITISALRNFYAKHAPEKVEESESILEQRVGEEEELIDALHEKYGEAPQTTALENNEEHDKQTQAAAAAAAAARVADAAEAANAKAFKAEAANVALLTAKAEAAKAKAAKAKRTKDEAAKAQASATAEDALKKHKARMDRAAAADAVRSKSPIFSSDDDIGLDALNAEAMDLTDLSGAGLSPASTEPQRSVDKKTKQDPLDAKAKDKEEKAKAAQEKKEAAAKAKQDTLDAKAKDKEEKVKAAQEKKEAAAKAKQDTLDTKAKDKEEKVKAAQEKKEAAAKAKQDTLDTKAKDKEEKVRAAQEKKEAAAKAKQEKLAAKGKGKVS